MLQGGFIRLDTSDIGQLVSYEEIMVDCCYDLNLIPFTPDLVLDCGAHIGLFTRLAAARYSGARLLAFEPHPGNCELLRPQFAELGGRATLHQAAVSVEEGERWFSANCSNTGRLGRPAEEGWRVRVSDLRQVIVSECTGSLLLKVDVEGEELRIIPAVASMLPKQCAVFFEIHHGDESWTAVTSSLKKAGFEIRLLRQRSAFRDGLAVRVKHRSQS
jgi:FkbM family methyltransferase